MSGPGALTEIEAHRPDIILLDLMLPGMDGYEVCHRIRETSAVPIIMLTARDTESDQLSGLEIGADEFAGYYYIEADTLFREEATGQDLPAQFVIPRGKIQSNFTFTMAKQGT